MRAERAGLTFLLLLGAAPVHAQSLRDYDYARPLRGERELKAIIEFAAGRLTLGPGSSDRLYRLALQYDSERFQPVGSYDAGANAVRMGVEGIRDGGIRIGRKDALPQTAAIELSRAVSLSLDVSLGAADAELELGGLRIGALDLKSGASRATVSFETANPITCRYASLSSGAGKLTVIKAGNSGCTSWHFDGGVGSTTLDLSGAWPDDAQIDLSVAVGGVTLQAPRSLGIRVRMSGFLAGFSGSGFTRSGKTWTSDGYERAARKVDVQVSSALGGVTVEWR